MPQYPLFIPKHESKTGELLTLYGLKQRKEEARGLREYRQQTLEQGASQFESNRELALERLQVQKGQLKIAGERLDQQERQQEFQRDSAAMDQAAAAVANKTYSAETRLKAYNGVRAGMAKWGSDILPELTAADFDRNNVLIAEAFSRIKKINADTKIDDQAKVVEVQRIIAELNSKLDKPVDFEGILQPLERKAQAGAVMGLLGQPKGEPPTAEQLVAGELVETGALTPKEMIAVTGGADKAPTTMEALVTGQVYRQEKTLEEGQAALREPERLTQTDRQWVEFKRGAAPLVEAGDRQGLVAFLIAPGPQQQRDPVYAEEMADAMLALAGGKPIIGSDFWAGVWNLLKREFSFGGNAPAQRGPRAKTPPPNIDYDKLFD